MNEEERIFKRLDPESRHYCVDWDFMAVDAFSPEWGSCAGECNCGFKRKYKEVDKDDTP